MRTTAILLSVVTAALVVAASAAAVNHTVNESAPASTATRDGPERDRATGGGQILVASQSAGSTIAFTAQGDAADGKGQIQFIDREAGTGQDQVKYHGDVACIDAEGNTAKIAGTMRDGSAFNLVVVDNGEGANADNDMIYFNSMADDPTCDFDDPDQDDFVALARGNVQVHDGN